MGTPDDPTPPTTPPTPPPTPPPAEPTAPAAPPAPPPPAPPPLPVVPVRWGGVETGAICCLVVAEILSILIPLAGFLWLLGLVLLIASRLWTGTEKVIGALVLATGFPLSIMVFIAGLFVGTVTVSSCTGSVGRVEPGGATTLLHTEHCTTSGSGASTVAHVVVALLVVYVIAQVVAIWRLLRARKRTVTSYV